MRRPGFGEANLGAMAGMVVGAIGGLFSVGIAPAIIYQTPAALFATPRISIICWIISAPIGWIMGGQIGPRLGMKFRHQRAEIIGGAVGGMVPIVLIALWGWYMVSR